MNRDDHAHDDIIDKGLQFDLSTMLRRRHVLGLFASASLATLVGCAAGSDSAGALNSSRTSSSSGECEEIPGETAGPYPGDGSNGANILTQSGILRRDIRPSFGSAAAVAAGVPLTINLTLRDTSRGCVGLAGAAVYLWHCDRDGNYSMYSPPVINENYLRGVQPADGSGGVTFTSVFPACYAGRWPHIHFEVYPSVAAATDSANKIATSQIALPADVCQSVYSTDGYGQSVRNLQQVSLAGDNVFGNDNGVRQLGTVTGSVSSGLAVALTVPV